MIRIAIVGYGYWGPNLVRNFSETKGAQVAAVCDLRPAILEQVKVRYPGVKVTTDISTILGDDSIDAVALATPVDTHAELALKVLRAGKHVLVEKPFGHHSRRRKGSGGGGCRAKGAAGRSHVCLYGGGSKSAAPGGRRRTGRPVVLRLSRVNLGLFRRDVSVLWDLAVHDLSILTYWLNRYPHSVSCIRIGASRRSSERHRLFNASV